MAQLTSAVIQAKWLTKSLNTRGMLGMKKEIAEEKAIAALGWLSSNDELIGLFFGASGLSLEDMRSVIAKGDHALLSAVVEFISQNDAWVVDAAGAIGLRPDEFVTLRQVMLGRSATHWT